LPDAEPIWLTRRIVDALHQEVVREFGGTPDLRDAGSIDSALARPANLRLYETGTDLPALGAAYAWGLVKNHGYMDGNKRVGAAAMAVFLMLKGLELQAPEPELVAAMLAVASGEWDEATLAAWVRENVTLLEEEGKEEEG
jgi:death-on-curing protein